MEQLLQKDTLVLSSDDYRGRYPGTEGELKSINYISERLQSMGLQVTYQEVPVKLVSHLKSKPMMWDHHQLQDDLDYVVQTSDELLQLTEKEMIFVGYGIVAPQWSWNDYKISVKDKIVVVLTNDPGYATNNPDLFEGKIMTFYGRWSYKFEEAFQQGAAGILVIHDDQAGGYPWSVHQSTNLSDRIELIQSPLPKFRGFLSTKCIQHYLGKSYADLCQEAIQPNFQPYTLSYRVSYERQTQLKLFSSKNVIGTKLGTGTDPSKVIYTAHWDHFGQKPNGEIFHGARDNALGVATLLAIAQYTQSGPMDVIFLFTTCEEQGLLGSKYYVSQLTAEEKSNIKGVLNFDVMNIFGKTKDISFYGYGKSTLDPLAAQTALKQRRYISMDPKPETGMFYRSDHWPFARGGIPVLFINMGFQSVQSDHDIASLDTQWIRESYHKPSDQVITDPKTPLVWDLSGAAQDAELMMWIGEAIAQIK